MVTFSFTLPSLLTLSWHSPLSLIIPYPFPFSLPSLFHILTSYRPSHPILILFLPTLKFFIDFSYLYTRLHILCLLIFFLSFFYFFIFFLSQLESLEPFRILNLAEAALDSFSCLGTKYVQVKHSMVWWLCIYYMMDTSHLRIKFYISFLICYWDGDESTSV